MYLKGENALNGPVILAFVQPSVTGKHKPLAEAGCIDFNLTTQRMGSPMIFFIASIVKYAAIKIENKKGSEQR
jgi:hypothetical protein